jgi:hypothetical protein
MKTADAAPASAEGGAPARSQFVALAEVFGRPSGVILALTAAEAGEAGDKVRAADDDDLSHFSVTPLLPA